MCMDVVDDVTVLDKIPSNHDTHPLEPQPPGTMNMCLSRCIIGDYLFIFLSLCRGKNDVSVAVKNTCMERVLLLP